MKVIHKARQMGKTYDLVKAYKEGQVIVCFSKKECSRIEIVGKSLGKDIKAMTFNQLEDSQRGKIKVKEVLIDNADLVLQNLLYPNIIKGITINKED